MEIRLPPPPRVQADVRRFATEFSQAAIQADIPIETRYPGFTVNFSFRGLELVTSGTVRRTGTSPRVEARMATVSFNFNGIMNSSNADQLATIAPTLAVHVRRQALRIRCNVEVILSPEDMRRWSGYRRALTRLETAAGRLDRIESRIARNEQALRHLRFREENTRRFIDRARSSRARDTLERRLIQHRSQRVATQNALRELRRQRRLEVETVRAASGEVERTARRLPRVLRRARSMAMARMAQRLGRRALMRIIPFVGAALVIQDIYESLRYTVALIRGQASFGLLHPGAERPVENPSENPDAAVPAQPASPGDETGDDAGGRSGGDGADDEERGEAGREQTSGERLREELSRARGERRPGEEPGDFMQEARRRIEGVQVQRFRESRFGQFMQRARGYDAYFEPDGEVRHPRAGMRVRGSLVLIHGGRQAGGYPVTIRVRQVQEVPTDVEGVVRLRVSNISTPPYLGVDGDGQVVGRVPARANVAIRTTRGRARTAPAPAPSR